MNNIVINKTSYLIADRWDELNLQQVRALYKINQLLNSQRIGNPGQKKQIEEQLGETSVSLLADLCGVLPKIAAKTDRQSLQAFIQCYTSRLFVSAPPATGHPVQNTFRWQGEWLRFPEPGTDINGTAMPMHNLTAVEFCEATDMYLSDALKYAPLITALLCRPAGEPYREQRCRQRALTMQTLPMPIVLHLFDMLNDTHRYLRQMFPYCYTSQSKLRKAAQKEHSTQNTVPSTWNDLLLEAAGFRPEAIRMTEQMNLYDFMRLLNAGFKRTAHRSI